MSDGNARPDRSRRQFLGLCGKIALLGAVPVPALAGRATVISATASTYLATSSLRLLNTHTGERLTCTYREDGRLLPDALAVINRILRDHRTDEVKAIDPALLDLMASLSQQLNSSDPIHVVSGYRSPTTNATLRRHNDGVARRSYHLEGKAVDLKMPGIESATLRDAALGERAGGVGYYPNSGFIHLDTGPVRTW